MSIEKKKIQYSQHETVLKGSSGLPQDYPIPMNIDNMLFYIQRNLNENTVVYELNLNRDGHIVMSDPISAYWIKYTESQQKEKLNYIQEKLAYGYQIKEINKDSFELQVVSYPQFRIYIGKDDEGHYKAYYNEAGTYSILTNIYVYAEDFGVFPDVKYIDIHGVNPDDHQVVKQKIKIN